MEESLETKAPEMEAANATPEVQVPETVEVQTEKALTRAEIVARFEEILQGEVLAIREEADNLKTQFYRLLHQEREEAKLNAEPAEEGEEKQPVIDELEQAFKALLNQYKEKKAEANAKREAEQKANQAKKEAIIAEMKTMANSETADVSDKVARFKELQAEWKTIGEVPAPMVNVLWKEYNLYQEQFYDLLKISHELREYDFKRNLELKTVLCEKAEALVEKAEKQVVEAFKDLQSLHEEWAGIGPVAKELREDIWARFKAASTIINKKHQDYFDALHAREEENLAKKQAIIEQLQAIDLQAITTAKAWDETAEKVKALQDEWRTIGFAPKKVNTEIYETYQALCKAFYHGRQAYYKGLRDSLNENLNKKRALLAEAEKWKASEEWDKATEVFVELQKQWKETGAVARKYSDEIWKQFSAACDEFFTRKKAEFSSKQSVERENLAKKQAILAEIEQLEITTKEETLEKLHALSQQYQEIGFVPFKDKDKIFRQFRKATDRIFEQLNIDARSRRLEDYSKAAAEKSETGLLADRRRLLRQYDALKQEIQTAENNILFFTSASGKGNKLVEDMVRNIDKLKAQLKELEAKIKVIDDNLAEE